MSKAGTLPPIDTWHPQVTAWMYAASIDASAEGRDGRIGVPDLVRALWSAGDSWSTAYRHLFTGAVTPNAPTLSDVPDGIYYAADKQVIDLFERVAKLGGGRITPWAILCAVATLTSKSATRGAPGATGVWCAPVLAQSQGGQVLLQRRLDEAAAMTLAGSRQLVAVLPDEDVSSDSEQFATQYVDGHFHMLLDDSWVLREPTSDADFWVLEALVPEAYVNTAEAITAAKRRVPGFLPWVPLQDRVTIGPRLDTLVAVLGSLRTLDDVIVGTISPRTPRDPSDIVGDAADMLFVALDLLMQEATSTVVVPLTHDRPTAADAFGHAPLATTLGTALALRSSPGPLAVALLGPSGSGRSTLLQFLRTSWASDLAELPEDTREQCAKHLVHAHIDASQPMQDPWRSTLHAALTALGAKPDPTPPIVHAKGIEPAQADPWTQALRLLIPGATPDDHLRTARGKAVAGSCLTVAGAAGMWALAPGPWALIPAAVLTTGALLASTAFGRTLSADEEAVFDASPLPAPEHVPDRRDLASACEAVGDRRVLITIDNLDRCAPHTAPELLNAVHSLLLANTDLAENNPFVVVIACDASVLSRSCPPTLPAETLIQVPLWLQPVDRSDFERAIATWTGLEFPGSIPRDAPRLVEVTADDHPRPDPLPVAVGLSEVGVLSAGDLLGFRTLFPLCTPSPRAIKALVNQFRICRALLPADVDPTAALLWQVFAQRAPTLTATLATQLRHSTSNESVIDTIIALSSATATQDDRWQALLADLVRLGDDHLPGTQAMRSAATHALRCTHVGPTWHTTEAAPTDAQLRRAG